MNTITVNPHNDQEERVLLAFLSSLKYDYQTQRDEYVSPELQEEILRRDRDLRSGKIRSRSWDEVRKRYL